MFHKLAALESEQGQLEFSCEKFESCENAKTPPDQ